MIHSNVVIVKPKLSLFFDQNVIFKVMTCPPNNIEMWTKCDSVPDGRKIAVAVQLNGH